MATRTMQSTGEVSIVGKRGEPVALLSDQLAEPVGSVFGRQKGAMTILGDIVNTDDVYAEGVGEMEEEWDELYRRT